MTKEKFIELASRMGYCNKKQAKEYCDESGKETFAEDDFIEVHRHAQVKQNRRWTTKRFFGDGGEEGNR